MSEPVEVPIHNDLAPLKWLLGRWTGVGVGGYPTIEEFRFGQEVSFTTDGRPFIQYASRAFLLDENGDKVRPLGVETGFLRPQPNNEVELLLAHPTGYAEVWYGKVEVTGIENAVITGARIEMHTDVIARTRTAKEYTSGHRLYGLVEGDLLWAFDMAAVEQPLQSHLSARLKRW
jgi:hypothetical protein